MSQTKIILMLWLSFWFLFGLMFWLGHTLAASSLSEALTVAEANRALAASGGMVGNIFAVGDNRYQVRSSHITGKRGNVFTGEIEIIPLSKHSN